MSYITDRTVSGFKVLDCSFFDDVEVSVPTAFKGQCCANCHKDKPEIIIRPRFDKDDDYKGMVDWFLGIEAVVCCQMYDYVRALPHQWWIDRALEYGTTRYDARQSSGPIKVATENTYRPNRSTGKARSAEARRQALERATRKEEEGGIESFLRR